MLALSSLEWKNGFSKGGCNFQVCRQNPMVWSLRAPKHVINILFFHYPWYWEVFFFCICWDASVLANRSFGQSYKQPNGRYKDLIETGNFMKTPPALRVFFHCVTEWTLNFLELWLCHFRDRSLPLVTKCFTSITIVFIILDCMFFIYE